MKKILSVLLLVVMLGCYGCSCSKTGEYKFDSIIVTIGNEEETFSCTAEEKSDNPLIIPTCANFQTMSLELTGKGRFITKYDGVEASNIWYKIEDGKFYTKSSEDDKYREYGKYEDGKIIVEIIGAQIIFKK